jgi:hypothetical protein
LLTNSARRSTSYRPWQIRPKRLRAVSSDSQAASALPRRSQVLDDVGFGRLMSDRCLRSRAMRDITTADRVGRFHVGDAGFAITVAAGALLGLTRFHHDKLERDYTHAADQAARDLLHMYGLPVDEAREVCQRPLPRT